MPLYIYMCTNSDCEEFGDHVELMVKLADFDQVQGCKTCGEPLKRTMPPSIPRHGSWAEWRTDLAAGRKVH